MSAVLETIDWSEQDATEQQSMPAELEDLCRRVPILAAADWLAQQSCKPSPIIPALRRRFGLTPKQACEAIRQADLLGWRSH